jgi:hypothetical protein
VSDAKLNPAGKKVAETYHSKKNGLNMKSQGSVVFFKKN